jgi:DNA-binding response OmpR family regulator
VKVLVVDDDPELLPLLAFALRQGGWLVIEAASGEQALAAFGDERPDLVVLDVNLPGIDGFEVLRRLRADGATAPVLMLTVRGGEEDVVRGLDLGADDYLTKPFSPRTLLARLRALLRRAGIEAARGVTAGALTLDPERSTARVAGRPPVKLTRLEYRLLQLLAAHAGRPVPAERIVHHVWGARLQGDRQALKQLVHRLRRKLEDDPAAPRLLVTEPALGYRLAAPEGGGEAD